MYNADDRMKSKSKITLKRVRAADTVHDIFNEYPTFLLSWINPSLKPRFGFTLRWLNFYVSLTHFDKRRSTSKILIQHEHMKIPENIAKIPRTLPHRHYISNLPNVTHGPNNCFLKNVCIADRKSHQIKQAMTKKSKCQTMRSEWKGRFTVLFK